MGQAIAFNPCFLCNRKEMCHLCELEMHRSGAISNQKWISVEDDTPKNSLARVQVFLRDADITDGIGFPKIDTDRYIDGKWVRWGKYVTHWMPLPDAPKGEKE